MPVRVAHRSAANPRGRLSLDLHPNHKQPLKENIMSKNTETTISSPTQAEPAALGDLVFTDKATYLDWSARWKAEYAGHTEAARRNKHGFKKAQREQAGLRAIAEARHAIFKDKATANRLIEMRHISKVKAQSQYMAEQALKSSASAQSAA